MDNCNYRDITTHGTGHGTVHAPKAATHKLLVFRKGCGHCDSMKAEMAKVDPGRIAAQHIHTYTIDGDDDKLGWVTNAACPNPHAFEFVHQPAWAQQFIRPQQAPKKLHKRSGRHKCAH